MLIYALNNTISEAIKHFNLQIKKVENNELCNKMDILNSKVINLISLFDIQTLFISITSFDSIFYRFKLYDKPFEFKWNVFPDSEEDENSALIIYRNGVKQVSYYGSVYEIYGIITDTINEVSDYSFEIYNSDITSKENYVSELSFALNSY